MFLKIAVSKRQTKSLKTTCQVVSFYYICKLYTWNLLKTTFSQAFIKNFAKITCDFPLYGMVKNLMICFAEAFQYFFIINLSHFPLFLITFLEHIFHLPVVVSADTCLKVTPKKLKQFPEIIYKCRDNATSTRYKLPFSLASTSNKSHHSHLKSIMHWFSRCVFMLHFDPENTKKTCCNLVAKGQGWDLGQKLSNC